MSAENTLSNEKAEGLIRLMTDGLVNIVDKSGEFLLKLDDGSVVDTKGWQGWEWTHGIALTALYHHSAISPSSPAAQHSLKTLLDWFESQYRITSSRGVSKNINTMSPFYSLAACLRTNLVADPRWTAWCDEWAEWVMHDLPRTPEGGFQHITYSEINKDQLWDDTLMMTVLPLAQIGLLLNRPHYVEEAKYQFLLHIQCLMDAPTGLWFHGWQFTPQEKGKGGHNFAKALWARGNAWITVVIPFFIELLGDEAFPKTDPIRRALESTFKRQVDALVETQDAASGLWHTLLVDKTSYLETSAAAGFAAGMLAGIRLGLLKDQRYLDTAHRALNGVIAQIQPDGEVANVSFGTGMGHNLQFYHDIPITSMPYGQALSMLALVEWERLEGGRKAAVN